MSIYRGPGGAGDATNDASSQASLITQKVAEAQESADSAASSASAAATSASNAAASASGVAESASAAATSASNASTSATAAASSASDAATSASDASSSAAEASSDASAAASSASSASSSASAASTSATNASNSATSAASSASDASTSASAASTSASNASSSATAAAASLDSFDDRYLGPKSSNPSVDNDGNSLLTGAIYWNTTSNEFRVWSGSTWVLFSGIPDQTDNSGKYLKTNGTTTSWQVVADPAAATPTNDGLIFGLTEDEALGAFSEYGIWYYTYVESTGLGYIGRYTSTNTTSGSINYWWTEIPNLSIGSPISITINGVTRDLGTVVQFAPTLFYNVQYQWISITNPSQYALPANDFSTAAKYGTFFSLGNGGNVSLGYTTNNGNGLNNTAIGYGTGSTITTGSNLTLVGYNAEPSSATATNEATFGNSATTNTRLFGSLSMDGSSAGTSGQVLTSSGSGTAPTWTTPASGTVTSVTGTSPVASSGGTTPAISLATAYGDTLNPYASKTANYVLAAPNGSSGVPTFRAIVAADVPTLNQNTTGTASNITGTAAIANGGTGQTTATAAFNALAPSQASNSGKYLTTDGTNTSWTNTINGGTF